MSNGVFHVAIKTNYIHMNQIKSAMKKIGLMAIFTVAVGLLSANAQVDSDLPQTDEDRITQDTVMDNSNIPDTDVLDSALIDTSDVVSEDTMYNNNAPSDRKRNNNDNINDKGVRDEDDSE